MSQDNRDIEWLLEEKYGGEKSEAFFADCRRLALGEPLGYLIGHVPFLGCTIHLDSRPLVPRPETEFWCEKAIAVIKMTTEKTGLMEASGLAAGAETRSENTPSEDQALGQQPDRWPSQNIRVLDLCAGSGCIGVAVAKALPEASVDFVEIDAKHKATIEKNLLENGIERNRSEVLQTSLFQGINSKYDFILSNPPYIDTDLNRVGAEVVDFEPHLALFGGRGGLEIISQIIATAHHHLTTEGQLWLEHEPEQTKHIQALATAHNFASKTYKDQYGVERYSILVLQ